MEDHMKPEYSRTTEKTTDTIPDRAVRHLPNAPKSGEEDSKRWIL